MFYPILDPSGLIFAEKSTKNRRLYFIKKRTVNLGVNSIEPGDCEFYLI